MTATATDTLIVHALTREDAKDKARWQWETFGFRVLRFVDVERAKYDTNLMGLDTLPKWRVTADLELIR